MKEAILNKVKSLMACTTDRGATKEEAQNALSMAYKLMAKHSIDESELKSNESEYTKQTIQKPIKDKWKKKIFSATAELYGCVVLVVGKYGILTVVGRPASVEAVISIAQHIIETAKSKAKPYSNKNSFLAGLAEGYVFNVINFIKTLEKINKEATDEHGIVLYTSQNKKDIAKLQEGYEQSKTRKSIPADFSAYAAGYMQGRDISLNKQVTA